MASKRRAGCSRDVEDEKILTISAGNGKDYAKSTLTSLSKLRNDAAFCDVELIADPFGGETGEGPSTSRQAGVHPIPAHRCVLASQSDYFRAMFSCGLSESSQKEIQIKGVSHNTLLSVVDFIYKGSIRVKNEDLRELTEVAFMLQVKELMNVLDQLWKSYINLENAFQTLMISHMFDLETVQYQCEKFIASHFGVLLKGREFMELPASIVIQLFSLGAVNLGIDSAKHSQAIEALQKWVDINSDNKLELNCLRKGMDLSALGVTLPDLSESMKSDIDGSTIPAFTKAPCPPPISSLPRTFNLIAVFGGYLQSRTGNQCPTASTVEVLDTDTRQWCYTSKFPKFVAFRTAVSLDGKLYFGVTTEAVKERAHVTYAYEPVMDEWVLTNDLKESKEAWWKVEDLTGSVRAVDPSDNSLYFCGSVTMKDASAGKQVWKVDLKKNEVKKLRELPAPRYHHGAVIYDGKLVVVGGNNLSLNTLSSVCALNFKTNEWVELSSMIVQRTGPGVAILNECLYAVGGTNPIARQRTAERYNPDIEKWELITAMEVPRAFPGVASAEGFLYVFGGKSYSGANGDGTARNVQKTCEVYDPLKNTWAPIEDMTSCRCEMITMVI